MLGRFNVAQAALLAGATSCAVGCIPQTGAPASTTPDPSTATSGSSPGAPGGAAPAGSPATWDHTAALALPSLSATLKPFFSVGAAVEPIQLVEAGDILTHHFERFTAENQMKLGTLCPSERCNFSRADQLADFARTRGMKMNGHTFVWHQMYPAWFFKDQHREASKELVSERLKSHIFTMTKRYADVVDNWDVVNEAVSDTSGKTYRDHQEGSPWFRAFGGKDYIKVAFQYAEAARKAYAPGSKLYYNDYNVVIVEKRRKIIEMVRWLRKEGVQIDGIGLQGHWNLQWPTASEVRDTIDELAAEGLALKISELDISIYNLDDHGTKQWQPQLEMTTALQNRLTERYRELFEVFEEKSDKLEQVTFWGISDDRTWLNYWPQRRDNHPLLFDRKHQPKPALSAILDTVGRAPTAPSADAPTGTPADTPTGSPAGTAVP